MIIMNNLYDGESMIDISEDLLYAIEEADWSNIPDEYGIPQCNIRVFIYVEDDTLPSKYSHVLVNKEEYETLQKSHDLLGCLEAIGVDNWSGWADAQEMLEDI